MKCKMRDAEEKPRKVLKLSDSSGGQVFRFADGKSPCIRLRGNRYAYLCGGQIYQVHEVAEREIKLIRAVEIEADGTVVYEDCEG